MRNNMHAAVLPIVIVELGAPAPTDCHLHMIEADMPAWHSDVDLQFHAVTVQAQTVTTLLTMVTDHVAHVGQN